MLRRPSPFNAIIGDQFLTSLASRLVFPLILAPTGLLWPDPQFHVILTQQSFSRADPFLDRRRFSTCDSSRHHYEFFASSKTLPYQYKHMETSEAHRLIRIYDYHLEFNFLYHGETDWGPAAPNDEAENLDTFPPPERNRLRFLLLSTSDLNRVYILLYIEASPPLGWILQPGKHDPWDPSMTN